MGDNCEQSPQPYPPSCDKIREIAEHSLRRRAPHGVAVSRFASKYFELISRKVKPGPELSFAYALSISLAHIHHLRGSGKDSEEKGRVIQALRRGIPGIPTFAEDFGIPKDNEALEALKAVLGIQGVLKQTELTPRDIFLARLEMLFDQYCTLSSTSFDYHRDARMKDYSQQVLAGGASLPTLIVKIADYCLDEKEWSLGAPSREELTPATKRMLSVKMLKVYFPLAEMFGWVEAARILRENGLKWDPELADKLVAMKEKMKPLIPLYTLAAPELGNMVRRAFSAFSSEGMPLHAYREILSRAVVQRCRTKTEAAVVMKMEDKGKAFEEIMDMAAARIVLMCEAGTVKAIGKTFYEMLREKEFREFTTSNLNNYYRHPKPSGYQAIHITGYMPFMGMYVPCEIQLTDPENYKDSCCGRSSRLVYKSGENIDDEKQVRAFNQLISPILPAAADVRGAIEVPEQEKTSKKGRETRTFQVYALGWRDPKPIESFVGATVADVAFKFMRGPYNAEIYAGRSKGTNKLGLHSACPSQIFIFNKGSTIATPVANALRKDPNVDEETKRMIAEAKKKKER